MPIEMCYFNLTRTDRKQIDEVSHERRLWPRASSLIYKETLEKRILQRRTSIEYRIMNVESSSGGQVSKECILSILYIKKSRAKPPARRAFCAYASESDIHNSSFVNLHSSFHVVSYKRSGFKGFKMLISVTLYSISR